MFVFMSFFRVIDAWKRFFVCFINKFNSKIVFLFSYCLSRLCLTSPKKKEMHSFTFQICRIFGVIPFEISQKRILPSKHWEYWSQFLLFVYLTIAVTRIYFTTVENIEEQHPDIIYDMMEIFDTYLSIVEILFLFITITMKNLKKNVIKCLQTTFDLANASTDKMSMLATFYQIFTLLSLYILVTKFSMPVLTDIVVLINYLCLAQTTFNAIILLYFIVSLNIMRHHIDLLEKESRVNITCDVINRYNYLLKFYRNFWKLYHPLISVNIFHSFYIWLLGIKCAEAFLNLSVFGDAMFINDIILLFWYFYDALKLIHLIYVGNQLVEKVFLV